MTFPEGESLPAMQARALAAVHDWNQRVGDKATYAMVSHGDVIKAIVADALGTHLDQFQRIVVDPASVSVIRYGARGVQVLHVNDRGSDLSSLARTRSRRRALPERAATWVSMWRVNSTPSERARYTAAA